MMAFGESVKVESSKGSRARKRRQEEGRLQIKEKNAKKEKEKKDDWIKRSEYVVQRHKKRPRTHKPQRRAGLGKKESRLESR